MQQTVTARTPMHLWIVGILSLLWNCIGWGVAVTVIVPPGLVYL